MRQGIELCRQEGPQNGQQHNPVMPTVCAPICPILFILNEQKKDTTKKRKGKKKQKRRRTHQEKKEKKRKELKKDETLA